MPTDASGGGARRWRDAIALYGGGCVPTPATHAPHQRVGGREARKADPTRPWAWTAPPEQRRDKGGFGGKKTFHPKDIPRTPRTRGIRRFESAGTMPAANPAGRHDTAGAKRPPLVLVCEPPDSLQAGGPINRRSPPGLCRPQVLPDELAMMTRWSDTMRLEDSRSHGNVIAQVVLEQLGVPAGGQAAAVGVVAVGQADGRAVAGDVPGIEGNAQAVTISAQIAAAEASGQASAPASARPSRPGMAAVWGWAGAGPGRAGGMQRR